jgi:hypothetical protein
MGSGAVDDSKAAHLKSGDEPCIGSGQILSASCGRKGLDPKQMTKKRDFEITFRNPFKNLWSRRADSNRLPADYESAALPTELRRQEEMFSY